MTPTRLWYSALLLGALAVNLSCGDPSPAGVSFAAPNLHKGGGQSSPTPTRSGLVFCPQTYDSVSQLIGPTGGVITVGAHALWVDSLVLSDTVRITAVAPADTVRWVRFKPNGLVFPANPVHGYAGGALLYTDYKSCG